MWAIYDRLLVYMVRDGSSVTVEIEEPISLTVHQRRFIHGISLPRLAQKRLYDPARKPQGAARLRRKLAQLADDLIHGWLNVPARGSMGVGDDKCRVDFDAHQSAYLAFVSRELHGGYEPLETLFLESVLGRASVFYDVGCNWGYFSLLAATHPEFKGPVFAFDVSADMNISLTGMAATLNMTDLTVTGYGLSDNTGSIGLSGERSAHLTQVSPGATSGRTATVMRLDDLDLPPPDVMKIDVEDHEQAVFEGGQGVLRNHRPLILFECRGDQVGSGAGEFLCALGYRLYALRLGEADTETVMLVPVQAESLSSRGQTNIVAVAEGEETRWFG